MRNFGRRFYLEALFMVLAGVAVINMSIFLRDLDAGQMKVYYYYSPDCPNCKAVGPLLDELLPELKRKNIQFIAVNTKDAESWNYINKMLAQKISEKLGTDYIPTPTATVWHKGKFYTFIGKDDVVGLSGFLHAKVGTRLVKARLKDEQFKVEDCISCHEAKKIPPPSTYNCTFCCHREEGKQAQKQ